MGSALAVAHHTKPEEREADFVLIDRSLDLNKGENLRSKGLPNAAHIHTNIQIRT